MVAKDAVLNHGEDGLGRASVETGVGARGSVGDLHLEQPVGEGGGCVGEWGAYGSGRGLHYEGKGNAAGLELEKKEGFLVVRVIDALNRGSGKRTYGSIPAASDAAFIEAVIMNTSSWPFWSRRVSMFW